jgi:hypothetical protein
MGGTGTPPPVVGTTLLPTPNAFGTINLSATSGKVALMNTSVPLTDSCPAAGTFVDLIGYGSANCAESATAAGLSNTTASIRRGNGCTDTGNNAADFVAAGPIPRNDTAPANGCGGKSGQSSAFAVASPDSLDPASDTLLTVRVTPATAPPAPIVSVTANLLSIGGVLSQSFYDDGTHGDQIAGDNVFSVGQLVAAGLSTGAYYLVATVTDAAGHTTSAPITLTIQSPTCGVERWLVKVGTDRCATGPSGQKLDPSCVDTSSVNLDAVTPAAILDLGQIDPPSSADIDTGGKYATSRDAPVETTVYTVDATMTFYKKETDVDYHIVLSDNASPTPHTLIAEIPSPACILAPNGSGGRGLVSVPFSAGIAAARAKFDARLDAQTFFQQVSIPVRVRGVGFFDFEHGQTGVAPNAIELHPVLDIFFRANTTTTLLSAGAPTYGQPLTFTATVTSGGENTPTGDVTFFDSTSGTSMTAALDAGGMASFSTSALAAGGHSLIASYTGDDTSVPSASAPLAVTVAKADQAIDFAALGGKTYGAVPFQVAATGAASGHAVMFAASGACSSSGTNGGTIAVTAAGSCTVTASQAGDSNYNDAASVDRAFAVAPANLLVTANSFTREFGTANPILTGTLSGVVAGDAITASYTTIADSASPVGSYPIVPVLNDPNARIGNYALSSQNGLLTVVDTTPPTGTVPEDFALEAQSAAGAVAVFSASATDAADGSRATTCSPASGTTFALGRTTVTCSSTDAHGNTATSGFTVTVRDTTPPAINAVTPSVTSIWPPNKAMIPVSLAVTVADASDGGPACVVTGISSNEPQSGDSAITGPLTVSLRADRNGNGSGRVYTIGVRCVDASGNASTSSTTVTVPHDQRQ